MCNEYGSLNRVPNVSWWLWPSLEWYLSYWGSCLSSLLWLPSVSPSIRHRSSSRGRWVFVNETWELWMYWARACVPFTVLGTYTTSCTYGCTLPVSISYHLLHDPWATRLASCNRSFSSKNMPITLWKEQNISRSILKVFNNEQMSYAPTKCEAEFQRSGSSDHLKAGSHVRRKHKHKC